VILSQSPIVWLSAPLLTLAGLPLVRLIPTLYSITAPMHRIRHEDLPHRGSSHRFVGADQGDTGISVFLFNGQPGSGPGPHRHPYDEVQFIQQGRGMYTVDGETFEAGAGDILVIKAGEVHSFTCIGDAPLVQLDVHLSPDFIQENLEPAAG
jgi:quercetin dioxygenase-like cupin family protein